MKANKSENRVKLTKKGIESINSPPNGYTLYWFDDIQGMGIRVTSGGVKSYILQCRIKGQEKRITLGRYPTMTPDKAKRKALSTLGEIADGGDPITRKKREKLQSITLEEAFEDYFKTKDLKQSTVNDMKRSLNETFKEWQKKPITKITRRMVEKRYMDRAKETKARANSAFRYLRAVFNLASVRYRDSEDCPILQENPVTILSEAKLWRKVQRRRTVLSPDDLKTWVPAVLSLGEIPQREPGKGRETPKLRNGNVFRDFFLFLALTGCRKGEALELKSSDVDLKRNIVTFRDTKNRTDHELPLTKYLNDLLKRRMGASKGEKVFSSPHDNRQISNLRYAINRITSKTGLHFTPHDLRRLAASTLERLGVPTYTVKAILNHQTGANDVTGGYVQVDSEMKLAALMKLERFILKHSAEQTKVVHLDQRTAKK